VAQRRIRPSEYLSGELLRWTNFPSDQPVHISLEIMDPGKEAVNYNLEFFAAEPDVQSDPEARSGLPVN
jgi:hypothetical protein